MGIACGLSIRYLLAFAIVENAKAPTEETLNVLVYSKTFRPDYLLLVSFIKMCSL